MFIKLLIALFIFVLFGTGVSNISLGRLKGIVESKSDVTSIAMIDKAILDYYFDHGSNLPDSITQEFLEDAGIYNVSLDKITYEKLANNRFVLNTRLGTGDELALSIHSNQSLPVNGINSEFDNMNSNNVDVPDGDDVIFKDVFIGDDCVIHGSVKIGDGTYDDGKHSFTHNYNIGTDANVNSDQVNIADNTEIGNNANIRNFVEIIGNNISIGDRVTLWSEATVGDNVNIISADKGDITFQTAVPKNTTIKRSGAGEGNLTFFSGSRIKGGTNEIYNESAGDINIYTNLPKDTTIKRNGQGSGNVTYYINSTIDGSHSITNESDSNIEVYAEMEKNADFKRTGVGNGVVTLNEEAVIGGKSTICNENSGAVNMSAKFRNVELRYIGGGSGTLNIYNTASFSGLNQIYNESKGAVTFLAKMDKNAVIKRTGNGSGTLECRANSTFHGTSEFRNESSDKISLNCVNIPDKLKISNLGKKSFVEFDVGTEFAPNTEFIVEGTNVNRFCVHNRRDNLELHSGRITVSGPGLGGAFLKGKFGGHLNIYTMADKNHDLCIEANKTDWSGETIKYSLTDVNGYLEKYLYICEGFSMERLFEIYSIITCHLYGSFADKTKINVTGNKDNGALYFRGNYSGNIDVVFNGSPSSYVSFYNNLANGNKLVYNAENGGTAYFSAGSILKKAATINNHSKYQVVIASGVTVGNNAVINVNKNRSSNVVISKSIADNAVVNY